MTDGMNVNIRDRETGRFVRALCDDPNCDGRLVAGSWHDRPVWHCDGLTYDDSETGPLVACERQIEKAA